MGGAGKGEEDGGGVTEAVDGEGQWGVVGPDRGGGV